MTCKNLTAAKNILSAAKDVARDIESMAPGSHYLFDCGKEEIYPNCTMGHVFYRAGLAKEVLGWTNTMGAKAFHCVTRIENSDISMLIVAIEEESDEQCNKKKLKEMLTELAELIKEEIDDATN